MPYHAVFMLTKSILKLMRQGVSKEGLRFLNSVQIARVQRPGFISSPLPAFIRRWQNLQSTSFLLWGFLCIWAYIYWVHPSLKCHSERFLDPKNTQWNIYLLMTSSLLSSANLWYIFTPLIILLFQTIV